MTNERQEELLSAYLDDELSADERAQVEQMLGENAELRQLYEELLSIRGSLQDLPRHKMDRDLSETVLRRAERQILSQPDKQAGDRAPRPLAGPSWWGRHWRRVVWPAAAIAAALVIALFDTQQNQPFRQVAQQVPQGSARVSERKAGEESEALSEKSGYVTDAEPPRRKDAGADADDRETGKIAASRKVANTPEAAAGAPMEQKLGTPAAAPATSDLAASKDDKEKETERLSLFAAGDELVDVDVPLAFIRERRLEKMLDAKKIAWIRVDEQDALDLPADNTNKKSADKPLAVKNLADQADKARAYRDESRAAEAPVVVTVVATPEQLNEVVNELQVTNRVSRSQTALLRNKAAQLTPGMKQEAVKQQAVTQESAKGAEGQRGAVNVQQQNAMIRLRPIGTSDQTPPAKPQR